MGDRTCNKPDCDRRHYALGLCRPCYRSESYRRQYRPKPRRTPEDRFWPKVDATGDSWEWTAKLDNTGYGRFTVRRGKTIAAHRFAYEVLVGPIPEGLQLDHLCRRRNCLNPDHLEPVTAQINVLRSGVSKKRGARTHCRAGHPYSADNVVHVAPSPGRPEGGRTCRACARDAERRYRQRKKLAA